MGQWDQDGNKLDYFFRHGVSTDNILHKPGWGQVFPGLPMVVWMREMFLKQFYTLKVC